MTRVKALLAAALSAAVAAPSLAAAHDWDDWGGGFGPSFGIYYAPPVYDEPVYYEPTYYGGPVYYRPYYRRYYYHHYYRPYYRHYYHHYYRRVVYRYVREPCVWHTRRFYDREGDYVIRHERICR